MPVIQVRLEDGQIVNVNVEAPVEKKPPMKMNSVGAQILSGLGQFANQIGAGAATLASDGGWGKRGQGLSEFADKNEAELAAFSRANSTGSNVVDAGIQGAAAGALSPAGGLKGLLVSMLAGGTGNATSQYVNNQFPNSPLLGLGAGMLAGGGTGFLTGRMLHPGLSPAEARVKEALEGVSPQDFAAAKGNVALFEDTGVQTATLAEAFRGNTPLKALAGETRASAGGESFAHRVAKRPEDLAGLTETTLKRIPFTANLLYEPNAFGFRVAGAADNALETTKRGISAALGARLHAIPSLTPEKGNALVDTILKRAEFPPLDTDRNAYLELAKALTSENAPPRVTQQPPKRVVSQLPGSGARVVKLEPQPDIVSPGALTSAQDISLALSRAKKGAINSRSAQGNVTIDAEALNRAYQEVIAAVDQPAFLPGFKTAKDTYAADMRQQYNPQLKGPIGDLTGANPNIPDPRSTATILNTVLNSGPPEIADLMHTLSRSDPGLPEQIATALLKQKLLKGSTNPGAALYGLPGSEMEKRVTQVLNSGGLSADKMLAPARAADLLQGFQGVPGAMGDKPLSKWQFFIRSLRSLDFMVSSAAQKKYYAEIADMLEKPTQENLQRLQEIAQHDSVLGRMATAAGVYGPIAGFPQQVSNQKEGK